MIGIRAVSLYNKEAGSIKSSSASSSTLKLGMIVAIEQFCQETCETVDMRVGVHTGTVLCGILGMKRFKFDVWSNDVNLANLMEQLGVAGKVHLSEATAGFLDDRYQQEDGRVLERATQGLMEKLKGRFYLILFCVPLFSTHILMSGRMQEHRPSPSAPIPHDGDISIVITSNVVLNSV